MKFIVGLIDSTLFSMQAIQEDKNEIIHFNTHFHIFWALPTDENFNLRVELIKNNHTKLQFRGIRLLQRLKGRHQKINVG